MTLSISRALAQGKKAALFVVLGTSLGIVVHTMLVAFGISALITASPTAFLDPEDRRCRLSALACRSGDPLRLEAFGGEGRGGEGYAACQHLHRVSGSTSSNPKVIIFFMTFLPQFVSAGDPAGHAASCSSSASASSSSACRSNCGCRLGRRLAGRLAAEQQEGAARHGLYLRRRLLRSFAVKISAHAGALNVQEVSVLPDYSSSADQAHRHRASGRASCGTWRSGPRPASSLRLSPATSRTISPPCSMIGAVAVIQRLTHGMGHHQRRQLALRRRSSA